MLNTAPEPKLGSFSKHSMFDLSGKVALVTGGSRGIGRAAVIALAERGAHVVVNYVSNESAARETVQAVEQAGGKAELMQFDVASGEAAEKAISEAAKRLGRLDILVNSAASPSTAYFCDSRTKISTRSCRSTSRARSLVREPPSAR